MKEQVIRTINIFLASSEELKAERDGLRLLEGDLNEKLAAFGLNVHFVLWEALPSTMNRADKQEEYNKALRNCEMCLVLFWTRFGEYTSEELNIAYRQLCTGHNPRRLHVFFKEINDGETITADLEEFRNGFRRTYGHYYDHFRNIDTLKTEFLLQFIDYQQSMIAGSNLVEVVDGEVRIGNQVFVNLRNVPFLGKNEDYNLLINSIETTQKILSLTDPNSPDHREYAIKLVGLKDQQRQLENSLWDTAIRITRLGSDLCNDRLQRAKDMFMAGNNRGTLAVLDEEEVNRDINHNLQLIQIGEEGKKGLAVNIEEMLLRINALRNDLSKGWDVEVERLYRRCISVGRGNLPSSKMIEVLLGYGFYSQSQGNLTEAENTYLEVLGLFSGEDLTDFRNFMSCVTVRHNLAAIYHQSPSRKTDCIKTYNENLKLLRQARLANTHLGGSNCSYIELALLEAETCNNLALLYSDFLDVGERLFKDALDILDSLDSSERTESFMASTLNNLSVLFLNNNKLKDSENAQKRALDIRTRLAQNNPRVHNADLAVSLNNLAGIYLKGRVPGMRKKIEELLKKALEIRNQLAKENPRLYEPVARSTQRNLEILYSEYS